MHEAAAEFRGQDSGRADSGADPSVLVQFPTGAVLHPGQCPVGAGRAGSDQRLDGAVLSPARHLDSLPPQG